MVEKEFKDIIKGFRDAIELQRTIIAKLLDFAIKVHIKTISEIEKDKEQLSKVFEEVKETTELLKKAREIIEQKFE